MLCNSTTARVLDDVRVMTKLGLQGRIRPYRETVSGSLPHARGAVWCVRE